MRKKFIIICLSYYLNVVFGQYENQSKFFNNVDFIEIDKEVEYLRAHPPMKRNAFQNDMERLLFINEVDEKIKKISLNAMMNKTLENNIQYLDYGVDGNQLYKNRTIRATDADETAMFTYQIVQKNGYPAEVYHVTTKDGYVLELHRIPYGKKSPMCRNSKKPIVFCMHDITSSSSDFIINGPEMSLGYLLADAGYDVWLGNARGNRYSRKHKDLMPVNTAFWDFTFHETGAFDLPAMIDFILEETEQEQMVYIGHSMSTTTFYVLMSEHPEYNSKFKVAFHLSPVVYLSWMMSPFLRLCALVPNLISLFFDVIGVTEFTPRFDILAQFGQVVCKGMDFTQFICTSVLFILSGYNVKNLNLTRFPVYMGHTPAGTSLKTFIHYGQIVQSGSFKKMDWAIIDNMALYNSLKPPLYKLLNMQTPVYMFYSNNDWFANKHDIDRLYREIQPGIAQLIEVRDPQFAHVDFLFGINAKEEIYDDLMEILKRY